MARAKKNVSTRARSLAARKGWETRRANEAAVKRKKAAAARKAAATRERKKAGHERRVEAAKKGARRRKARLRAAGALESFKSAVDQRAGARELRAMRQSWHRSKRDLYSAYDEDYEDYLGILDAIADETDTSWDIAYGPEESAA